MSGGLVSSSGPAWIDIEALEACRSRLARDGRKVLVVAGEIGEEAALETPGSFDAAWIAPGSTRGLDVAALGRRVAAALRPASPVACAIPGCWPLPAVLEKALRGTGEWAGPRRARAEGREAPCLSASSWRRAFGPGFSWHHVRAVGVLLPLRPKAEWAERHALSLGVLAAAEHVIASWPLLRALGDRLLLEGIRR